MTKYVELKTAIDAVNDVYYDTPDMNLSADKLEAALRGIPDADVAPVVHARWIGSHGLFQGKCSVCGYMTFDKSADWARNYWPYCSNCGARMDGDDDALD